MNLDEARKSFAELQKREFAYNHAMGILYYDGATVAPKESYAPRGVSMGVLSEALYGLATGEATRALLDELAENADKLSAAEARELELMRKDLTELRRIPVAEYVAYTELVNEAEAVWHKAKAASDFPMFRPFLEKIVAAQRRFASLVAPEKDAYDYLLDKYEEGLTQEKCGAFFAALRSGLSPLVEKAAAAKQPDGAVLRCAFPQAAQEKLSARLMELMGIDRDHCGIGTTEHPFTTDFSKYDVRITTHYHEDDFTSSMYSVIHEGGHALYELHTADEYAYTELGTGVSMGIHESQSRFYENILGRSRPFADFLWPYLVQLCPALASHSAEEMYRAVNRVQPSLIRTEADEFTYPFHVMIRYELEKKLISGELDVAQLPEQWNALYKEYLGVDVPDDRRGVLQDSHWSGGSIGYFPSYALGSAYGAQYLAKMKETVDVDGCLSRGDFAPVNAWLEARIWKYGRLLKPGELFERAVGAPFDPKYYVNYLSAKLADVYGL